MGINPGLRRRGRSVVPLVALAAGSLVLVAGGAAPSSGATVRSASAEPVGLAQSFVSAGLCDGGPRYRVLFHQVNLPIGPNAVADLTVTRAGKRAAWDWTGEFTTHFADGSKVSGINDFGRIRSSRAGRLQLRLGTVAGAWHSISFALERRSDGAVCRVIVRG
jgi:hypothetical protein